VVYHRSLLQDKAVPTHPLFRYLGSALRERRESFGHRLTMETVARKARLTVRHLQKLEQGNGNPKLETLLAVAKALRTNVQSLLDRAEEMRKARRR
jgi:transcriptional regulator with XRE-family HTH domain